MGVDEAALGLVFASGALRELTGAERAGHLRYKPGTGLTAALFDAVGAPVGWLRVVADGADKLANARRRAGRRGLAVESAALSEHCVAFWGPILTDPSLAKAFDDVDASLATSWRILRYNPLRRLVVRATDAGGGDVAGRLTAEPQDQLREAHDRIARQVPTVARVRPTLPRSARITWWDWCDGGDLAALASTRPEAAAAAAREAGEIAARLHQVAPPPVDGIRGRMGFQLAANADLLTALDGGLGTRFAAVTRRLLARLYAGGPSVTCHGDLSPDQFFLKGTRVRLGDLDRVTAGPAAFDLGSFAATSPALLDDFLAGYRSVNASTLPPDEELGAWAAYAHAIRALEPFRAAAPDWRDRVAARLHTVEEALCNPS